MDWSAKSIMPGFIKAITTRFVSKAPPFNQTWAKYWIYYVPLWLCPILFWLSPEIVSRFWFISYFNAAAIIARLPYQRHKVDGIHFKFWVGIIAFSSLIGSIFVAKYLHVHYGLFNDKFVR
jgi:hypothetical protein